MFEILWQAYDPRRPPMELQYAVSTILGVAWLVIATLATLMYRGTRLPDD